MADTLTLGKRRTVRFSHKIDRLLKSRAAAENKSVSVVIRDSVVASLQDGGMTAGEWILSVANNPPRFSSPERLAFRKKYLARHK
jgi:hypothetical protein